MDTIVLIASNIKIDCLLKLAGDVIDYCAASGILWDDCTGGGLHTLVCSTSLLRKPLGQVTSADTLVSMMKFL